MKILVTYYSRTGNTKKIATEIAKNLKADLDEIVDLKNRSGLKGWIFGGRDAMKEILTEIKTTKNPANYDLVIIGTPIWAWNATPAVRTYITQFKNQIKKVAFFTTSGGTDTEKTVFYLENLLDQKSIASAGWIDTEIKQSTYHLKLKKFLEKIY